MPTFCKPVWFESFRYTVVPSGVSPYILSGGSSMQIELREIPKRMLYEVTRVRQIVRFRMLTDSEQTAYKCDVYADIAILDMSGRRILKFISRKELVRDYRTAFGKKIRLIGLHYRKTYLAVQGDNRTLYATKVKGSHTLTGRGRAVPRDTLVVFSMAGDAIDYGSLEFYTGRTGEMLFKKQYHIVGRVKGAVNTSVQPAQSVKPAASPVISVYTGEHEELDEIRALQEERSRVESAKVWSPTDSKEEDELKTAPYVVMYKLLRGGKSLVGFIVRDTRLNPDESSLTLGKGDKPVNLSMAKELCISKQIRNMTIGVRKENNKVFFRGVGIRLENVPQFPVERLSGRK